MGSPQDLPVAEAQSETSTLFTNSFHSPRQPSNNPKTSHAQWFWQKEKDYFDGKRHFREGYRYQRPSRRDLERSFYGGRPFQKDETTYRHVDIFGRETRAKRNTLTYISPTESVPKPLMVQATRDAMKNDPQGDWRRVKLKGNVPSVLKISVWALKPKNPFIKVPRVILVVIPIIALLSIPLEKVWEPSEFDSSYTEFPNYCWEYPKHARNRLDTKPYPAGIAQQGLDNDLDLSSRVRLLKPRMLVTYVNGKWILDGKPQHQKYLFISFTNVHFPTTHRDPARARQEKSKVEAIARERTLAAGLTAYWIDTRCCAPPEEKELHTADVHRMCDVIRGAEYICVVLPKLDVTEKRAWGARMWTLPEALLARRQELIFASPKQTETLSKLDMTAEVWDDGDPGAEGDHQATRLLAEHYSNVLTLGRLELFSVALDALSSRSQAGNFSSADIAYALMGLLHYRIPLDHSDTLFQALARLSLANDSDRLIERMVCMLPNHAGREAGAPHQDTFLELTERDVFGSHLWDIEPLCQVAGVGYGDKDVILDSCRGVSIRWKSFPRIKYKRSEGFWKFVAEIVLRSGAYWGVLGLGLLIKYIWSYADDLSKAEANGQDFYASNQYSTDAGLIFLGVLAMVFAFLLMLAAPSAVKKLYGGRVMQSAPWLIGFEGTKSSEELEKIIFGNSEKRLSYAPSNTPYSQRQAKDRVGVEPGWIADPEHFPAPLLPKGHRFFTLVDTGALEISIFSAVRPPSVALIAGREGGMLRTVLCHYERSNNCLYKETVMRMDSITLNHAKTLSWVKVNFGNDYDY